MFGFIPAFRAHLARGFRSLCTGALWIAAVIAVVSDLVDPERPESLRHPHGWAWRIVPAFAPAIPDTRSGHPEP